MRKTRSYASFGDRRLRASCTCGFSSGIRSSALSIQRVSMFALSSHSCAHALPSSLLLYRGRIPQSQLPVASVVKVPLRERLHPALQPRPLHDVGGERGSRHCGRCSRVSGGVVGIGLCSRCMRRFAVNFGLQMLNADQWLCDWPAGGVTR